MIAALTPLLIFIAFLLLLLVSLSAPIISSIYLFRLSAHIGSSLLRSSANASINFGVWGYCLSAATLSIEGFSEHSNARCSARHLGYTFDSTVANALHATELQNLISRTTTVPLVLNPIAAGLAFLTLLVSLFMLRRGLNGTARFPSFITFGIGILASILTTVVFLIDVIVVAVVRKRVHHATDGDIDIVWGNAVWMTLGAAIALWLSVIGACCGIFTGGGRKRGQATY